MISKQDEFVNKLNKISPELSLVSQYVNMKTKVNVVDELGIEYKVFPESLLKGSKPKITSALNPTEAFRTKLKHISPELELISHYEQALKTVQVKDELGIVYAITPASLLTGNKPSIRAAIDKTDAIKKKIAQVRDDCTVVSEYQGDKVELKVKGKDGVIYEMIPYNLLIGHELTFYAIKNKEAYIQDRLNEKGDGFRLISKYAGYNKNLSLIDKFDIQYSIKYPSLLRSGFRVSIKSAKDTRDAIKKIVLAHRDDIKQITKITSANSPIQFIDFNNEKHQMRYYKLLNGAQIGFNSAINKSSYFDALYSKKELTHKYERLSEYKLNAKLKMNCELHGEFSAYPYELLNGVKCAKCAYASNLLSIDDIVDRAKEVHAGYYSYPSQEYKGYFSKLTIHCPMHGSFKQTIAKHLAGSSCRKCANEKLSGTLASLAKYEPDTPYTMYNVILWDDSGREIFGKLGLAKNFKLRMYQIPYSFKLIELKEGSISELYAKEQEFFKEVSKNGIGYTPRIKFGGYTECYKLDKVTIEEVKNELREQR